MDSSARLFVRLNHSNVYIQLYNEIYNKCRALKYIYTYSEIRVIISILKPVILKPVILNLILREISFKINNDLLYIILSVCIPE